MRRFLLGLAACISVLLLGCSTFDQTAAPLRIEVGWPHDHSDLQPDPKVVWGRLENGLRYAILPHAVPTGRASICLLVQAGSYQENDDERGYAHFVEHMVFRGTSAFPADTAVQALQRLGVAMGPDLNADTGYFATDYRVQDLRLDDPTALPTGLAVLRGFAGSATFDSAAIAAERGVIFGEKRARGAALATASDQQELVSADQPTVPEIATTYEKQRVADRHPIGTDEALNAATAERLRAFYQRWYRPEHMILAVVGDVAPAQAETLIRETFSDLAAVGTAPAEPVAVVSPAQHAGPRLNRVISAGEPAAQLSFCSARAVGADTAEARRLELVRGMALNMLLGRIDHAADAEGVPIVNTDSVLSHAIPGQELAVIRVKAAPQAWPEAGARVDAELRRACAHGFTDTELARRIRRERAATEGEVYDSAIRPSGTDAVALARSIASDIVFTSAEAERARIDAQLATMTLADCNRAIRDLFGEASRTMTVVGTLKDADAGAARLTEALRQGREASLPAYVDFAPRVFPYAEVGAPGAIVADTHDPVSEADLIRFANGVRLNLKRTDFEPHRVAIFVRFGHGALASPADRPWMALRCFAWMVSGVGDLSQEQEQAALPELNGWNVTVAGSSSEYTIDSAGASGGAPFAVEDLAAHFAHPAIRPEAWQRALALVHQSIAPHENTAAGVANNVLTARLTENPALTFAGFAQISSYTAEEFRPWFLPQLGAGPIEISIVGDFDPQEMRATVARTFGALAPLNGPDELPIDLRRIKDPAPQIEATTAFVGADESAAVRLKWTARDVTSAEQRSDAAIVARLLDDRLRLKLRAEMGETYTPEVAFGWNDIFHPSPTTLEVSIEAAPERVAAIATAARATAETLAHEGATPEEFERARQPLVFTEEANRRTNAWWIQTLQCAQSRPATVRAALDDLANYRGATLEHVNAIARQILTKERCHQMIALPASFAARSVAVDAAAHADSAEMARKEFARRLAAAPEFADVLAREGGVDALGLDIDSLLASAFVDRSGERFNRQDYAAAIVEDDRVIALQPKWPEGYNNRGAAKAGLNDLAGAIANYTKAIALNPEFVGAYTNRAAAETAQQKYRDAIADYTRAIKLQPNDAALYHARAEAKEAAGDKSGAAADRAREKQLSDHR